MPNTHVPAWQRETMDVLVLVRGLTADFAATGAMTLSNCPYGFFGGIEGLLDWQVNQRTASRTLKWPTEDVVPLGTS